MFIPASLGNVLARAALPKIEESIWYPDSSPPSPTGVIDAEPIGLNLGLQFASAIAGEILSVCYWRWDASAPSNGTVALWIARETVTPRTLLATQDFTGHTGTGWKKVDFDTPIRVSTAESYFATIWLPAVDGSVYAGSTPYYFVEDTVFYSENNLLWAWPSIGQPFPAHGIYKRNGWFKYGAFDCPNAEFASANYWIDVVLLASPPVIPPDPPIVLKWEIPEGYPTIETTGVPPGTVLTPLYGSGITTSADEQIIENYDITGGYISVRHHNCIVRKCRIYNRGSGIGIDQGMFGTIIEDCEINLGGTGNANPRANAVAGHPLILRRCNLYRGENGLGHYGGYNDGTVQIFEDNFIHHLRSSPGTPHYDCMQFNGGQSNIIIRHNTLHNENSDTSAILIENLGGAVNNILIEDNIMNGGGYTTYCVSRSADPAVDPVVVHYYNNKMRAGVYGYFINTQTTTIMIGNQFMDHGEQYDSAPLGGFDVDQMVRERFVGMPAGVGTVLGTLSNETISGLTLGLSFTVARDISLTGVNIPKLRSVGQELSYKVGVWRFTGANRNAGHVLLYQETVPMRGREGWNYLPFTTPVSLLADQNILVGVWFPPNAEGKVWYTAVLGVFDTDLPSQFGRATAFNGAGVPLNGFTGGNGLYAYGSDLAIPLNQVGSRPSYNIDPILEALWTEDDNVAPEATNLSTPEGYFLNTPVNLTNIVVSDVDSANVTAILTLSDPSVGSLNTATSGAVTSTYSAGVWTASGAIADVNVLLAGLTFTPATGFNDDFSIATSVSDGEAPPLTGTKEVEFVAAGSPTIPISYFDARFAGNTSSPSVRMESGTLLQKSITETGISASVVATGYITVDTCRISSREAVRVSSGMDIHNCYLEAEGQAGDHADTIQVFAPGMASGVLTVTETAVVAHNADATAGLFIADDWGGTVTLNNVVFWGGPYGLRIHADPGRTVNLSMTNVFFVGPFGYDTMLLSPEGSGILNITHWENVRDATIVDGVLVPGDVIPIPFGSTSVSTAVTGRQMAITAGNVSVTTTSTSSTSTTVTGRQAAITAGSVTVSAVIAGSIPLTWSDGRFAGNANSGPVSMSSGTLLRKTITETGVGDVSIMAFDNIIIDTCRVNSREGVRVAGNGVDIRNSYIESLGEGDDHADSIQAYAPGERGSHIQVSNSSIVAHTVAATAGLFVADNWGGTVTLNNVVFNGGPYGCRIHADPGCTVNVYMKDVFFVGPWGYAGYLITPVGSGILNITHWENVRNATIVGGVLVPGSVIPEPS